MILGYPPRKGLRELMESARAVGSEDPITLRITVHGLRRLRRAEGLPGDCTMSLGRDPDQILEITEEWDVRRAKE